MLIQQVGIDDTDYRDDLEANYGVRSCSTLTYQQAEEYIGHLRQKAPQRDGTGGAVKRYDELGERPGMATPAQLRMLEVMWKEVSWHKTDREARDRAFCSWLYKRFKRSHPTMISAGQVGRIVKALEAMKQQKLQPKTQTSSNEN